MIARHSTEPAALVLMELVKIMFASASWDTKDLRAMCTIRVSIPNVANATFAVLMACVFLMEGYSLACASKGSLARTVRSSIRRTMTYVRTIVMGTENVY